MKNGSTELRNTSHHKMYCSDDVLYFIFNCEYIIQWQVKVSSHLAQLTCMHRYTHVPEPCVTDIHDVSLELKIMQELVQPSKKTAKHTV